MDKIAAFRKLHQGPGMLVLPSAWDVASARIFEEAGFAAVATTSAGVANSLGYPDGERISRDEMIAVVKRIAGALKVPVTADMEAGYGDALATARAVVDAGGVGMNLEDSDDSGALVDLATQVRIIEKTCAGVDMGINARCDVYLRNTGDPDTRFKPMVERLNAYDQAGADSLFAPGVRDAETIAKLARAVKGPLNVLAVAAAPPIPDLDPLAAPPVTLGPQ